MLCHTFTITKSMADKQNIKTKPLPSPPPSPIFSNKSFFPPPLLLPYNDLTTLVSKTNKNVTKKSYFSSLPGFVSNVTVLLLSHAPPSLPSLSLCALTPSPTA